MIIDFSSSQLINAFISHVRNLEFGRCFNDSPRIQIGECEITYTFGTSSRQVLCLFHYIPCDRIGGRHLVLFGLHYWNKGISCVQPFVGFGIRCSKGIWRALKKLMSIDFSYMVISGCARASRATVATFPRFCEYRSWLNFSLGASLTNWDLRCLRLILASFAVTRGPLLIE